MSFLGRFKIKWSRKPLPPQPVNRIWLENLLALAAMASSVLVGCDRSESPMSVTQIDWTAVKGQIATASEVKVFFNHQSVGADIISGVESLVRRSETGDKSWTVVKLTQGPWPAEPGLWHATLGENEKPKTKIDAFAEALRQWPGDKPQIAMLKLCFVDVTDTTDVPDLIGYYQGTIGRLKSEFPGITFGHVTVPLSPPLNSLKVRVKRAIGRRVSEDEANLARNKYNQRLRELFPDDPILDLERIESTAGDGKRIELTVNGTRTFAMAQAYASDAWGHLNDTGQRLAAIGLAEFIADAATRKPSRLDSQR